MSENFVNDCYQNIFNQTPTSAHNEMITDLQEGYDKGPKKINEDVAKVMVQSYFSDVKEGAATLDQFFDLKADLKTSKALSPDREIAIFKRASNQQKGGI